MFPIRLNKGLHTSSVLLWVVLGAILFGLGFHMGRNQIFFPVSNIGFSNRCCQKVFGSFITLLEIGPY